ncbi:MAG: glycosyltransferase family 9 protein [Rhodospirillales bacterium]|nr:glycosyltransferase family 9 protein [Rhodospirillales bacterium]
MTEMQRFSPETILVYVGGDLVGDGLIKLPFVRALRHAFPDAHITWMAGIDKTAYAGVLASLVVGLIDETIEEAGFDRWNDKIFKRPLGGRRFDLIIDTQRGVPRTLLLRRIRHGRFLSGAADFHLSDRRPPRPYKRPASLIRQLMALVELASGQPPNPGALPSIDEATRRAARALFPEGPRYIGLSPGAGSRIKCWPLENFTALARRISGAGHVAVFLLGPSEMEWRETLERDAPDSLFPPMYEEQDFPALRFSPMKTIVAAEFLAVAVANDSGSGHMFAAADAPLVTLFGPTSAEKFAPMTTRSVVVTAQEFGSDEMSAIPVEAVMTAIESLIGD